MHTLTLNDVSTSMLRIQRRAEDELVVDWVGVGTGQGDSEVDGRAVADLLSTLPRRVGVEPRGHEDRAAGGIMV